MEDMMAGNNNLKYRLNNEYLKNCTIFGKANMKVNQEKSFRIPSNVRVKEDDFEAEM